MKLTTFQYLLLTIIIVLMILLLYLLISQVREKYQMDDPVLKDVRNTLLKLHPAVKDIKFMKGDKSYTINKKKIYLCLKDENGKYYNKNMLMYVTIHELAHVLCDEVGHTEKFHKIFDGLLEKATQMGMYNPSIPLEENYCEY